MKKVMENTTSENITDTSLTPSATIILKEGDMLANYFLLTTLISTGSNSAIFSSNNTVDGSDYVVKVSCTDDMKNEADIYNLLTGAPKGIPARFLYSPLPDSPLISFLIIQKLGKSLQTYWDMCENRFSNVTIARIAIQILDRLRFVHGRGVIHRNITPENLVMGGTTQDENIIYLIDYGSSQCFKDLDGKHVENTLEFTAPYFRALNLHHSGELSRRDDLVSLGYLLVRLRNGSLPWDRQKGEEGNAVEQQKIQKNCTARKILCKGLPHFFRFYFQYVDSLEFTDEPDYSSLILLFKDYLHGLNGRLSTGRGIFEWMQHPDYVQPLDLGYADTNEASCFPEKTIDQPEIAM